MSYIYCAYWFVVQAIGFKKIIHFLWVKFSHFCETKSDMREENQ